MDIVVEVVSAYGQLVSIKKTEVLLVQPRVAKKVASLPNPVIKIDGQILSVVSKFKYVGSLQNTNADVTDEIDIRIRRMAMAYQLKRRVLFENKRIKLSVRLHAFCALVITAGIYGAETWNSSTRDTDRLESKQYWYLRRIHNYHWSDMKSFADLIHESRAAGVNVIPISALVIRSRLTYFGHINRMKDNRYPKMILNGDCMTGKKLRGGQELTYKHSVLRDLRAFGISEDFNKWGKLVQERNKWRTAVKEEGYAYFMQGWFNARAEASNTRHLKADANYTIKAPYLFESSVHPKLVNLTCAIKNGAVTVGRGKKERNVCEKIKDVFREAVGERIHNYVRTLLSTSVATCLS